MSSQRQPGSVDKEEWDLWLSMGPTRALREWARLHRQELFEMWEDGAFDNPTEFESMIVKQSTAKGASSVYRLLEEMDPREILGDSFERDTVGPGEEASDGLYDATRE